MVLCSQFCLSFSGNFCDLMKNYQPCFAFLNCYNGDFLILMRDIVMVELSSQSNVLLSRYCTKHKYLLAFGELDMKL